ncbi:hypothetical protein IG631_05419 [Alternaria alternata]|nr:hypothetical protein IG631_05419 [Alternaria alternata]
MDTRRARQGKDNAFRLPNVGAREARSRHTQRGAIVLLLLCTRKGEQRSYSNVTQTSAFKQAIVSRDLPSM